MWIERHGKAWRIREEVGGRKVTLAGGFPTKTAARDAMIQLKADQLRGNALVPRGGQVTVAELAAAWWPTQAAALKPSAAHSEGARLRNHILPMLGAYRLDDLVDGLVVQAWVAELAAPRPRGRGLAPKTIRNIHGVLHQLLQAAVRQRLIATNPCAQTALPRVVRREMRFLTEPEIGRLVAAVPDHWRPLVLLLVATGLRWGEAVALRVRDLDVLAGRATVTRTLHELPGSGEIVFTEPKSRASRRTVTFPAKTVGAALATAVAAKRPDDLVFTAPRGGPVRTRNFRRGWIRWTVAAGLAAPQARGEHGDRLRIHDLRHTHAAHLISAGVPLTAIQRRLGHASIAVTSDLYGHLLPAVDAGIMAAVDAALAHVDAEVLAAEVEAELSDA